MKTKSKYRWLRFLAAVALLFWGGPQVFERWNYATSDGITRSEIDTKKILHSYEVTNDFTEIHRWIIYGIDGAPGAQMCMTLGHWSIEHPNQFIKILNGLPAKERERFIEVFSSSLNQSSPQEFEVVFTNTSSSLVKKILKELAINRPVPWPTRTSQS